MQEREESREERRQQVRIVYDDIAARAVRRMDQIDSIIRELQSFEQQTQLPDDIKRRAKKVGWLRAIFGL